MFRYSTILRDLVQSLAKAIFLLKHSVKLSRCILCGNVTACHGMACVFHTPFNDMLPHLHIIYNGVILVFHTPFHDMLPHLHIIYNDVILLSVLIDMQLYPDSIQAPQGWSKTETCRSDIVHFNVNCKLFQV